MWANKTSQSKSFVEIQLKLDNLHAAQIKVISNAKRFNVVCCGRRWGKTKLAPELLLSPDDTTNGALNGFPVAYLAPTYKMLMEVWRDVTSMTIDVTSFKSEAEKRIKLITGGIIDFWSLEEPNAIRGKKYKRIVFDECAVAKNLNYAWLKVVRPLLTDLIGDAWFLSTPKGKNNYFYDLSRNAEQFPDVWTFSRSPTIENPFIDPDEVEQARQQLDPLTFAQEYLASFVTENLDAWAYCYSDEKHIGITKLDPRFDVRLSFDFNRNPITCGVFQYVDDQIRAIEQIKLENSNIYNLCDHIIAKYGHCVLLVTGDATGKASSALVRDNINYYTIIKSKLNLAQTQMKVPLINPPLNENRVLVNSVLHNKTVIIDRNNCKGLIFDLQHAQVLPDGSLDKTDRNDPTRQLDSLDCFRYYLNTFHKNILKM